MSGKYSGRGRGWNKKPINKRKARQVARYRAGLIIESVLQDYRPDDLIAKYGEEGLKEIVSGLEFLSSWLIDTGHPK